ncbi:hypothetical protein NPIL_102311 [Nephila pilipes]|uniref:Uncharacterized protein n=1 Tax=Nephila pilipes TaxID=299642 RepID=A0A8X6MU09_NEPPI|nr:hypothetical protein NPIL_102311 [Nephila pilipes]
MEQLGKVFNLVLMKRSLIENLVKMENVETNCTQKNAIMHTANNKLWNIDETKSKDWFDQECILASQAKAVAYKNMLQKWHSRRSVEDYKRLGDMKRLIGF